MFQWKPDMVRFMKDASEYGSYHREVVEWLRPWLRPDWHVCDAGCGLGYLSLALEPYVRQVTAVDVHPDALAVLRENCKGRESTSIEICQGDIQAIRPARPFDAMVFCFYGEIEGILAAGKRLCDGTVFVFMRNYDGHRFSAGNRERGEIPFPYSCRYLSERQIPYEARELTLELGQPFRSLADARRFFEVYTPEEDRAGITDAFVKSRLRETGEEEFPYYLPHEKQMGFLKFETKDIPS